MIYYLAIFLLSAATLLLELALLRLFAVQQFYHFAFMAISLALLGAGASGSILSLQSAQRAAADRPLSAAWLCLGFGTSTAGAFLIINYLPFDSFSIAWDRRQVLFLALYFLAAAAPFIFAGLVVGRELMLAGESGGSHRVYGANLLGSAVGSLGSLPVLAVLGGEGATMLAAVMGATAGLLFVLHGRAVRSRQSTAAGTLLAILVLGGLWLAIQRPSFLALRLSPYKSLATLSQSLDARHVLTRWSASARVDVVESSTIHIMPGLSLLSQAPLPPQVGLLLDGDSLMPINGVAPDSAQAAALADAMPQGIAYRLRPGAHTLVLEAGAGLDVLLALAAGAQSVTAVEENELVVEAVRDDYREFTGGLYSDPRVTIVDQSGRVFARQPQTQSPDVLVVALTDPHRPVTSGAYSLTEDYTYTVGAFGDYLDVLTDGGLLVITRWLQTPPSESARTFGMLAQALRAAGHDPEQQIIAFRTLRTMTFLASPQPFTEAEMATVRDFLQARSFDAVYFNGIQEEELNRYNVLPEAAYYTLFQDVLREPQATYENYRYDIRPAVDDRPFFFHYFKWRQTPEILATLGMTWQPFGGSGYFVLVALLLLVLLASAALIFGPLLWRRRGFGAGGRVSVRYWRLRVLVYFAGLGLGFLFIEVPLAQRFILVLDEPVTALAVVLFSVLLFSGLGSLTVPRWRLPWALGALVLLAALYPLLLEPFAALALRLPPATRIPLTVLILAPLGYFMGIPFAGGLRIVERYDPSLVPWAWAINGSFSVISAVLAVMIALSWGFSAVLWVGAAAYAGALLALGLIPAPGASAAQT
ncbi:MAG TPA: hypothetical protein VK879_01890 [Candidatus Sulfomarinibacteraceae bacterium]|nr:hypothetical protein [Candidatus Sulfomarinibacteraceae bacterium]